MEKRGARPSLEAVDFSRTPFIVFWEITRSCALACRHCRAVAQPRRHPQELSTEAGQRLVIDQVVAMGAPLLVITGGDPMMRPDLFEFITYSVGVGLRVSLAPSATRLLTRPALEKAQAAGLSRISISLDGASPESHDRFRGTDGSFQRTLSILKDIRDIGLSVQVNTTVSRYNVGELGKLAELIASFSPTLWDLFFLVPTGRGQAQDVISPQEHEEVFLWLYRFSRSAPFDVKTTAAQHYRRMLLQQSRSALPGGPGFIASDGIGRAKGVNDGNGCCFVSHVGEVCPSGFLPVVAGNVLETPLSELYRSSPLFLNLRNPDRLKGKCGRCEYKTICGGSRSRAYAFTGDYLEAEPCCVYQPQGDGDGSSG